MNKYKYLHTKGCKETYITDSYYRLKGLATFHVVLFAERLFTAVITIRRKVREIFNNIVSISIFEVNLTALLFIEQ